MKALKDINKKNNFNISLNVVDNNDKMSIKEGVAMNNVVIVKKDGTLEPFKTDKIKKAVSVIGT